MKTVVMMGILLALLYLTVAQIRYRYKHPELTDTQLIIDFPEWALWR